MKEIELNSVGEGVCDLFGVFETDWVEVSRFCSEHEYDITVISLIKIYDWGDRPLLELGKKAIKAISLIGATWRADMEDHSR